VNLGIELDRAETQKTSDKLTIDTSAGLNFG
jgi:hypothetical protein